MAAFLYIEGIQGDATEANHRGEIELVSVSLLQGSIGGGGGGHGQINIRELSATKKPDRASTALWKAAASGEIFAFMILDIVLGAKTTRYTMRLVMLAGMSLADGIETFNLNFDTLSIEYL